MPLPTPFRDRTARPNKNTLPRKKRAFSRARGLILERLEDRTLLSIQAPVITSPDAPVTVDADSYLIQGTAQVGSVKVYADANSNGKVDSGEVLAGQQSLPGFGAGGKAITDLGGYDYGQSLAVQSDGKILLGGRSWNGSDFDFALARYNKDGTLDTTLDGDGKVTTDLGGNDFGQSVAVQADGKILVAGRAGTGLTLVRYRADGSLDTTFDGDGRLTTDLGLDDHSQSVAVQADGKILLVGYFFNGANDDSALVRYNADGSLDTKFGKDGKVLTDFGGNEYGTHVAIQDDGKILLTGYAGGRSTLMRYHADGSLDTRFHGDGKLTTTIFVPSEGQPLAVQADGKILLGGKSGSGFTLARYHPNGSLDATFDRDGKVTTDIGSGWDDYACSVAVQADGKILLGGRASNGGNPDFALVRYNVDGSLDTTFDGDGRLMTDMVADDYGQSVAVQADGKILLGGYSWTGVNSDFILARYNADGSLDAGGDFSIKVSLTQNAINQFVVTATDAAGNVSPAAVVPPITESSPPSPPKPDLRMLSMTAAGTQLSLSYEVIGSPVGTFGISIYRSGTLLETVIIDQAADRTVGVHTKVYAIGEGPGQVTLPSLAGHTETNGEYFVSARADAPAQISEADETNNTATLVGVYQAGTTVLVHGTSAADRITMTASGAKINVTLNGATQSFAAAKVTEIRVRAHEGADTVIGSTLTTPIRMWGGAGDDVLQGGKANDVYVFDCDTPLGRDEIADAGGIDTLDFTATATRSIAVDLSLTGDQTVNDGLTLRLLSGASIENVLGGAMGDTLTGNALANYLEGRNGADTLAGGAGNDVYAFDCDTALGSDTIDESETAGGGGADLLMFSATTTRPIAVDLAVLDAAQTVNANLALTLTPGSTLEKVLGGAMGDTLKGNAAPNTLIGGGGNDTLWGRGGNDTYVFDSDSSLGSDTIDESAAAGGGGTDTLNFAPTTGRAVALNLATVGAAQVVNANLTLTLAEGTLIENAIGGAQDDILVGNGLVNVLSGNGGNNILLGAGGNDTLRGGPGRDVLIGGSGRDRAYGAGGDDLLIGGTTSYYDEPTNTLNLAALNAILLEWKSSRSYSIRVGHLRDGGGFNGTYKLNPATIGDDRVRDSLFGEDNDDWILANAGDATDAETATPI